MIQGESTEFIHPVKSLMNKYKKMKLNIPFSEIKVNFLVTIEH